MLLFMFIISIHSPQSNFAMPEANIKVKISDDFIGDMSHIFLEQISTNLLNWDQELNYDGNWFTITKDGHVYVHTFRNPVLKIEPSFASDDILVRVVIPQIDIAWAHEVYAGKFGIYIPYGRARCHYILTNLRMDFTVPAVSLYKKNDGSLSEATSYSLQLPEPMTWNAKDWKYDKWQFSHEVGQGDSYGDKLMMRENQEKLLDSLARFLTNCSSDENVVTIQPVTDLINSTILQLPSLSSAEPLLKVNNPRFAQLNTSQLYDYVSMGVYGDNRRSLWFVINLKSGQKLSKREAAEVGRPLEKPNNDLSLNVQRVPYTIKLDQDSAQMKALEALEGYEFTKGDLFGWRTERMGAVSDVKGLASQLTNHEIEFGGIHINKTQMGRSLRWCFSLIEVDKKEDFFSAVKKYCASFSIVARSLVPRTWYNGTSFYHHYTSHCGMEGNGIDNLAIILRKFNSSLKSELSRKFDALKKIIERVTATLTIEWTVNLPARYSYSKVKSDWRVHDSVVDVELQGNIV